MHSTIHSEIARARLEDSLRAARRPRPAGRSRVRSRRRIRPVVVAGLRSVPRHV